MIISNKRDSKMLLYNAQKGKEGFNEEVMISPDALQMVLSGFASMAESMATKSIVFGLIGRVFANGSGDQGSIPNLAIDSKNGS